MAGAGGAVVAVAVEVVAEEAEGLLVDDDLGPGDEERALGGGERAARPVDEAAGEGGEDGDAHRDAREVALVLVRVADRRAGEVAEVVEGEAGHHGVEVHDAQGLAGRLVEEDVRDLRVVVGGADGDLAPRGGPGEGRGEGAAVEEGGDLGPATRRAGHPVRGDPLLEGGEACRRVVEAGDRLVERRFREVPELGEEAAERPGGLPGLGLGRRVLRRAGALDPRHEPPRLAPGVHVVRGALARGHEGEDAPSRVEDALAREAASPPSA